MASSKVGVGPGGIGCRLWVASPPHGLVGDRERIWEGQVSVCRAGQDRGPQRGTRELLSGGDEGDVYQVLDPAAAGQRFAFDVGAEDRAAT